MRHGRQVHDHGPTVDVATDTDLEWMARVSSLLRRQDVAEGHYLTIDVRHLHADGPATRDGSEDADIGRGHRIGDVLAQALELGDLDTLAELEHEPGDGRPDDGVEERGGHTELVEGGLEQMTASRYRVLVDLA